MTSRVTYIFTAFVQKKSKQATWRRKNSAKLINLESEFVWVNEEKNNTERGEKAKLRM